MGYLTIGSNDPTCAVRLCDATRREAVRNRYAAELRCGGEIDCRQRPEVPRSDDQLLRISKRFRNRVKLQRREDGRAT